MIYKSVELYNIEELIESPYPDEVLLSRVPEDVRLKLNEYAKKASLIPSGSEIRFKLKGDSAKIKLRIIPTDTRTKSTILEVYRGSFQGSLEESPQSLDEGVTEIIIRKNNNIRRMQGVANKYTLLYDPDLVRIILPRTVQVSLIDIEGEVEPPEVHQVPPKKYLAYGSSITAGGRSIHPTGSYAMKTARCLGMELINLGFGGGAYIEEEMADYIAQRNDWDIASLELGINVIAHWDEEQFRKKVDYFISKIALNHPEKWIFCIDIFTCYRDIEEDAKIKAFRKVVENKILAMNMPKLVYIKGRTVLNNVTGLTEDLLHPSVDGMEEIAINLTQIMKGYAI